MKKIMIVDDQPEIRELVSVTLEIGPYQILTAENGDQALEIARAELPELMLLDVMMPGGSIDGFEVCKVLKNDEYTRSIYILILTAKGQKDICRETREKWMDSTIPTKTGNWIILSE